MSWQEPCWGTGRLPAVLRVTRFPAADPARSLWVPLLLLLASLSISFPTPLCFGAAFAPCCSPGSSPWPGCSAGCVVPQVVLGCSPLPSPPSPLLLPLPSSPSLLSLALCPPRPSQRAPALSGFAPLTGGMAQLSPWRWQGHIALPGLLVPRCQRTGREELLLARGRRAAGQGAELPLRREKRLRWAWAKGGTMQGKTEQKSGDGVFLSQGTPGGWPGSLGSGQINGGAEANEGGSVSSLPQQQRNGAGRARPGACPAAAELHAAAVPARLDKRSIL